MFELKSRDFAYYSTAQKDWIVEAGDYDLSIGASSADIRLHTMFTVTDSSGKEETTSSRAEDRLIDYEHLSAGRFVIDDKQFSTLYGQPLPASERDPHELLDIDSTLSEFMTKRMGRKLIGIVKTGIYRRLPHKEAQELERFIDDHLMDLPLRGMLSTVVMRSPTNWLRELSTMRTEKQ